LGGILFGRPSCTPTDVDDAADDLEGDMADATDSPDPILERASGGTGGSRDSVSDSYKTALAACAKADHPQACVRQLKRFAGSPLYKSMADNPAAQVRFWTNLGRGLSDGTVDLETLKALNRVGANYAVGFGPGGSVSLDFIGGSIGGGDGLTQPVAPDFITNVMRGIQVGVTALFGIAAGFSLGLAVGTTAALGAAVGLGILALALVGVAAYTQVQSIRERNNEQLKFLVQSNTYEKNPCGSKLADGIFDLLATSAEAVVGNPGLIGGDESAKLRISRKTVATSVWGGISLGFGAKVGVSGFLDEYPLAAKFTPVEESQFGNIAPEHAEKKLIEEIGRRSNSASIGQVYMFVRQPNFKGVCIGCDISFMRLLNKEEALKFV
jgi:hypothetical protein